MLLYKHAQTKKKKKLLSYENPMYKRPQLKAQLFLVALRFQASTSLMPFIGGY